jgi:8-amino-7-oxononanoate synthase
MEDQQRDALTSQEKRALLEKLLKERGRAVISRRADGYQFPQDYIQRKPMFERTGEDGIADLLSQCFDGINNDRALLGGADLLNFCSYNYLGLSGHPSVSQAAIEAIERYGTSVSASRLVSGERPVHRDLENALAKWIGAEDAVVFVGGFSTNVDVIGHLLGPGDLIVYDSLIHTSVQQGARLAGASAMVFPHNNIEALENILRRRRKDAGQVLIVAEGVYSMDGDIVDLPHLVELKKRADALLMIDEAHSIGVLGRTGRGVGEHFGTAARDVDLWMGTLSKSFASCGGYIAGGRDLVTYLRRTAPGFVYSVGMPPASAAAALAALRVLEKEPERVTALHARCHLFHDLARKRGLDTGAASPDAAVVPIMIRDSLKAARLSRALLGSGILALPIGFPAVAENAARLRFFIGSSHSEDQITRAVATVADEIERLNAADP